MFTRLLKCSAANWGFWDLLKKAGLHSETYTMESAGAFRESLPEESIAFSRLCDGILSMEAGFTESRNVNVVPLQFVCCSSVGATGVITHIQNGTDVAGRYCECDVGFLVVFPTDDLGG